MICAYNYLLIVETLCELARRRHFIESCWARSAGACLVVPPDAYILLWFAWLTVDLRRFCVKSNLTSMNVVL